MCKWTCTYLYIKFCVSEVRCVEYTIKVKNYLIGKAMDIQRMRNLTTGRLHTKMDDVYKDIQFITGLNNVFTHELPRLMEVIEPYLRKKVTDERFWDGKYDTTHIGDIEITPMDIYEKF